MILRLLSIRRLPIFLATVAAIGIIVFLKYEEADEPRSDGRIAVRLGVDIDRRDGYQEPVFKVSVVNVSSDDIAVIDTSSDWALQAVYSPLIVTSPQWGRDAGPLVDVRVADVSKYMISLAPGHGFEYVSRLPRGYPDLTPGKYRAHVTYRSDPFDDSQIYRSRVVEFEIVEAKQRFAKVQPDRHARDRWALECQSEPDGPCTIYFAVDAPDGNLPRELGMHIGWPNSERMVITVPQHYECRDIPAAISIDDGPETIVETNGQPAITGDEATNVVDHLKQGERLRLLVHVLSTCTEQEIVIPLNGFGDAWLEYMAKRGE